MGNVRGQQMSVGNGKRKRAVLKCVVLGEGILKFNKSFGDARWVLKMSKQRVIERAAQVSSD